MKGVILDQATLLPSTGRGGWQDGEKGIDFSPLTAIVSEWDWYDRSAAGEVVERLAEATVVVTNKVVLDRKILSEAARNGRLQLICVAATGTNNVDIAAADELGIAVCNVTAYAAASVTEHVFMLMLALIRHLPEYQKAVSVGRWQQSRQFCLLDYPISELSGCKLGIVGYGELGQSVTRVAAAFGMQVVVSAWPGINEACEQLPFEQLLEVADIITLHCPLTPTTHHMISSQQLKTMQAHALLINTARGGIVDEQALADALLTGQIGGAAIDVLDDEPPPINHPLLCREIPNLIVTPHIAWASVGSLQCLINEIAENIRAWSKGQQRNRIC